MVSSNKNQPKNLLLLIFSNFAIMMKFTTLLSTFIPLVILQNDDLENVSNSLKVTHYDCSSMQENKMYALNQVALCKVSPENLYTTDSTISVCQRSYRTYLNAVMCKIKTFPIRYNCGIRAHSSIVHNMNMITYEFVIPPEDCEKAAKNNKITVNEDGYTHELIIKMDESILQHRNEGTSLEGDSSTSCKKRGQIKHCSYETHMQKVQLKPRNKTSTNPYGIPLPCTVLEGGCKSTSLDPYAYTWDMPENCVVTKFFSQKQKMVKYANKLDHPQYHIRSEGSAPNGLDLKIRIYNKQQEVCSRPGALYKTNFESLFISYSGGFDMNTGKSSNIRHDDRNYYQMQINENDQIRVKPLNYPLGSSNFSFLHDERNNKNRDPLWRHVGTDEIDYELHLGAKLGYIMYFNAKQLRHSEMKLLQNQCELERTQILTIMMLALQNTRLAGYMLTGNRSMFLDTDGAVGWLYHCPKKFHLLKFSKNALIEYRSFTMGEQCLSTLLPAKLFLLPKKYIALVATKNAFQLDLDDKLSWYQLMPAPIPFKTPLMFAPHDIGHITEFPVYDSRRAGMYTPKQLKAFWDNIIHNTASTSILKKITRTVLQNGHMDYANSDALTAAMGLNQKIYLDSLLSSGFFMNSFIGTFGFVSFFLEKIGISFACFLFLKFLLEIIVTIIEALEFNKLTNRTMSFWKIILGATYNFFVLSVFTSVFSRENSNLESSDLRNSRQKQIRQQNHNQNIYQESTASIPMVERNEPAVPLMPTDSQNEPGLYPDLNNQNEHLVRNNVIGTISSTTIPRPTTNNNTITPI